jgi:hypothetical protein
MRSLLCATADRMRRVEVRLCSETLRWKIEWESRMTARSSQLWQRVSPMSSSSRVTVGASVTAKV